MPGSPLPPGMSTRCPRAKAGRGCRAAGSSWALEHMGGLWGGPGTSMGSAEGSSTRPRSLQLLLWPSPPGRLHQDSCKPLVEMCWQRVWAQLLCCGGTVGRRQPSAVRAPRSQPAGEGSGSFPVELCPASLRPAEGAVAAPGSAAGPCTSLIHRSSLVTQPSSLPESAPGTALG